MANRTALQLVNAVLKKANLIAGDAGELTTFTDSARQNWVDTILQAANEVISELYTTADAMLPEIISEGTITLVASDRDYSWTGTILYWPLVDETNGRYIEQYPGGYEGLIRDQPVPGNFTGLPLAGAISPDTGEIYLDRLPTASEAGLVYKYRAKTDGELTATTTEVPFPNEVFRAVLPAIKEKFLYHDRKEFSDGIYQRSMAHAGRLLFKQPARSTYGAVRRHHASFSTGISHPFEE